MDSTVNTNTAGEKVRALRKTRGWRQQELADRAGVNMQTVSNLETGRHAPELPTLLKISGALGVPLTDLL